MVKQGLASYYQSKIDELSIVIQDKAQNLRRLEAQRNDANSKGAFTQSRTTQRNGPDSRVFLFRAVTEIGLLSCCIWRGAVLVFLVRFSFCFFLFFLFFLSFTD